MVYLDYAANSKVDKEVLDVFYDTTMNYYANPNSSHKLGLETKALLDNSTNNIANYLNILPEEIIYTSGATESNNLAIKGICERYKNRGKHIILSSLEHNSIIASATVMQENGFDVDLVSVTRDGIVDIDELKSLIRNDTILVSICSVDSEIGIKQPIEEIATILKDYPNIFFHTDASQAIGKVDIDLKNVDLVTIAPHKFYGMNGFGALVKKKHVSLKPMMSGGRSTTVFRSGTPIVASVVALDKALELAFKHQYERNKYVSALHNEIISKLSSYKNVYINSNQNSIPYTINFSIKGIKSTEFSSMLEGNDIYISTKTSCCPVGTPSKLIYALTHDKTLASSSLRISICHLTTKKELEEFFKVFDACYKELEKNGKI